MHNKHPFLSFRVRPANELIGGYETTFGDSVEAEFELGTTFFLGSVGLILGFFTSVFLLCCCCYAGNGPLYCGDGGGCCLDDGGNAKLGHATTHA